MHDGLGVLEVRLTSSVATSMPAHVHVIGQSRPDPLVEGDHGVRPAGRGYQRGDPAPERRVRRRDDDGTHGLYLASWDRSKHRAGGNSRAAVAGDTGGDSVASSERARLPQPLRGSPCSATWPSSSARPGGGPLGRRPQPGLGRRHRQPERAQRRSHRAHQARAARPGGRAHVANVTGLSTTVTGRELKVLPVNRGHWASARSRTTGRCSRSSPAPGITRHERARRTARTAASSTSATTLARLGQDATTSSPRCWAR